MAPTRPEWTRRQREQLRHLANYVDYLSEKAAQFAAKNQPIPRLLREAIRLLPRVKKRIEKDDFDSPAQLWCEVEIRIVEWHIEESKQWKPRPTGRQADSRPS